MRPPFLVDHGYLQPAGTLPGGVQGCRHAASPSVQGQAAVLAGAHEVAATPAQGDVESPHRAVSRGNLDVVDTLRGEGLPGGPPEPAAGLETGAQQVELVAVPRAERVPPRFPVEAPVDEVGDHLVFIRSAEDRARLLQHRAQAGVATGHPGALGSNHPGGVRRRPGDVEGVDVPVGRQRGFAAVFPHDIHGEPGLVRAEAVALFVDVRILLDLFFLAEDDNGLGASLLFVPGPGQGFEPGNPGGGPGYPNPHFELPPFSVRTGFQRERGEQLVRQPEGTHVFRIEHLGHEMLAPGRFVDQGLHAPAPCEAPAVVLFPYLPGEAQDRAQPGVLHDYFAVPVSVEVLEADFNTHLRPFRIRRFQPFPPPARGPLRGTPRATLH